MPDLLGDLLDLGPPAPAAPAPAVPASAGGPANVMDLLGELFSVSWDRVVNYDRGAASDCLILSPVRERVRICVSIRLQSVLPVAS